MSERNMIYRNGRGQIKHYEIHEVSRGDTHIEAIHEGQFKTFRVDSVLEWLAADDDPGSHLAYWRASTPKTRQTRRRPGRIDAPHRPESMPFPDRGQKNKSTKSGIGKQRDRRTIWAAAIVLTLVILGLVIGDPDDSSTSQASGKTAAAVPPDPSAQGMPANAIYREDVAGDWPLTIDPPVMAYCPADRVFAIRVVGAIYPINGTARTYGKQRDWTPLEDIWTRRGEMTRVNIGPMIDAVRERCAS